MNDQLLEELLNEDEGSALDFKRDQYPFPGATDDEKSELLKDILSFANSWRRTDAYILIGVDEVVGGRSKVVGVSTHLGESHIQQFVNSKTQRPVEFSYQAYVADGVPIGIIRLPKQQRPFYTHATYGKVRGGTVYLRRGSATDIADPDEIARMGLDDREARAQPSIRLDLADYEERTCLGLVARIASAMIKWPARLPDYREGPIGVPPTIYNRDYFRDVAEYARVTELMSPMGLAITNGAGVPAKDAQVQITCEHADMTKVLTASEYPNVPSTMNVFARSLPKRGVTWTVVRHGNSWTLTARVGSIQPKETWWAPEPFYIGGVVAGTTSLTARVFADNLADPVEFALTIDASVETRSYNMNRLKDYLPPDE